MQKFIETYLPLALLAAVIIELAWFIYLVPPTLG